MSYFSSYFFGTSSIAKFYIGCIKMKIIYFDFTLGSEKYKKTWSNYERNIFNILKVKSFKGSMYLKIILFKNNLKKSALFMTIYKKIKKINF